MRDGDGVPPEARNPSRADEERTPAPFPVVGIGASAGGLAAIEEFLQGLTGDLGAAYVVIQHLDPSHESHLVPLLAKSTRMPVRQAEDGVAVVPGEVYVIPPNASLTVSSGRLRVGQRVAEAGLRLPIDAFLLSLAEDRADAAIAVILSGTGSDGAMGIRAVQAAGGFVVVQDPTTAQHDGMPRSAIATGFVDQVAPVGRIPGILHEYLAHPLVRREGAAEPVDRGLVDKVLSLLVAKTHSDFRQYKKATILRRVERRMGIRRVAGWPEYIELLRSDPDEAKLLSRDLLIRVTRFFREPEAFDALRTEALAPLVRDKSPDDPIRVWVPGCATGEEAYSLAILLHEEIAATGQPRRVSIFATDLDEAALEFARLGLYPGSIENDVSPERLARFFTKEADHYRIDKQVRESVVFAVQNVISDPAFSRVDLVSCRNVLIYLEPELQKRVFAQFDFALAPGGYLFVGKSDGTGWPAEVFEPVSRKHRIFRHVRTGPFSALEVTVRGGTTPERVRTVGLRKGVAVEVGSLAQAVALEELSASLAVVNRAGRIHHLAGTMARYMDLPTGDPDLNLLTLARGKLAGRLRGALRQAASSRLVARCAAVPVAWERRTLHVDVSVRPLPIREGFEALFVVVLREATAPTESSQAEAVPPAGRDRDAVQEQLEAELRSSREELRTATEEFETSSEELKAANEEVMSMNEELQSANEELETSKEEQQSLNEELSTVNAQIQQKLDELNVVNDDLANLLAATDIATLFLDTRLRVKRFTPSATGLLNLISADLGRPIGHLAHGFAGLDLAADADLVLRDLRPIEKEVLTRDGAWYLVRMLLYRTHTKQVDGVVITFTDVTRLKLADERSAAARRYAESVVEAVREPLLVLDAAGVVVSTNGSFLRRFGGRGEEIVGRPLEAVGGKRWDARPLAAKVRAITAGPAPTRLEVAIDLPDRGSRLLAVTASRVEPADVDAGNLTLLAIEDVTESRMYEERLRTLNEDLEARVGARTAEAEQRASQLRVLASEIIDTERQERSRLAKALHDHLQQLLVGAKLQVGAWQRGVLDDRLRESAGRVQDLLDQCVAETRSLAVDLSPPVLNEAGLAAALAWLCRHKEQEHGLRVELAVGSGDRVEPADPDVRTFLFEAVRELLFNVVKHSGVLAAKIAVDRVGDEVVVRVQDEGSGFDPLTARATSGTGLGLFALHARAKLLGGSVSVESAPGHGTRVTLRAPAGAVLEEARRVASLPASAVSEGRPSPGDRSNGHLRILLVDDHEVVRRGLAALLEGEGDLDVVGQAADGVEAVEQARSLRPDVVVMDISMPRMNGIEATRQIHDEYPDVRIVGLSMHDQGEMEDAIRNAGATDMVTKGSPTEALLAAIRGPGAPA